MKRALLSRFVIPVLAGIISAVSISAAAMAQEQCESQACRLSTGNCDGVDTQTECAETKGGCTSQSCPKPLE